VDWRVYARARRLVTRLYRAERTIDVHVVLDVSPSMGLAGKLAYARTIAELVTYVGQRDALTRVHTTAGVSSPAAQGRTGLAPARGVCSRRPSPSARCPARSRACATSRSRCRGCAERGPRRGRLRPARSRTVAAALIALRARGLDAAFLQVVSDDDLYPPEGRFELIDAESDERRTVGPEEVRAYRGGGPGVSATYPRRAVPGGPHARAVAGARVRGRGRRRRGAGRGAAARPDRSGPGMYARRARERAALVALRRAQVLVPPERPDRAPGSSRPTTASAPPPIGPEPASTA
jgi:uncharacterized protein (DUF58 family)